MKDTRNKDATRKSANESKTSNLPLVLKTRKIKLIFFLVPLKYYHTTLLLKNLQQLQGHLVAQSVKHLPLAFRWGRDLRVVRWSPTSGFTLSGESA